MGNIMITRVIAIIRIVGIVGLIAFNIAMLSKVSSMSYFFKKGLDFLKVRCFNTVYRYVFALSRRLIAQLSV